MNHTFMNFFLKYQIYLEKNKYICTMHLNLYIYLYTKYCVIGKICEIMCCTLPLSVRITFEVDNIV